MSDFTLYTKCLDSVEQFDLDFLSKNNQNEETYMNFLRYVNLLGEADDKKVEGKKLIDRIYTLEKFKGI